MPSRPVVALVLAFWAATLGLVAYRDVWPRLVASGPPPLSVDLQDEASQLVPVRWQVLRGDKRIGRLTTQMTYGDADDTFLFTHRYTQLEFDVSGFRFAFPELTTTTRVTRSGALREQSMVGRLLMQTERRTGESVKFDTIAEAKAAVHGRVIDGVFVGHCDIELPGFPVKRDLTPVPVPEGQVLNPLQPLNRIANIRPGQRWVIREVNPLDDALAALFQEQIGKHGLGLPEQKLEPLIATVSTEPELLEWGAAGAVPCWVIEYRATETRARTWVRTTDGKVLRQEAFGIGERLTLQREE